MIRARVEFDPSVSVSAPSNEPLFADPNARNLVAEVSIKQPRTYGAGNKWKVLAIDCGIKANIIRSLIQRDCEVPTARTSKPRGRQRCCPMTPACIYIFAPRALHFIR